MNTPTQSKQLPITNTQITNTQITNTPTQSEQLPTTIKDDLAINKFKSLFKLDDYYNHSLSLDIDFTEKDNSDNIISYFKTAEFKLNQLYNKKTLTTRNLFLFNETINKKHKLFYLESLNYCKISTWNKCFDVSNNKINIDYYHFTKFLMELRNALFGPQHYVGKSFSDKQILIGNLANYYIQYLSQNMFGHPQLFELFKNIKTIKKTISIELESIINKYSDTNKINNLLNEIPLKLNNTYVLSIPIKINKPDFDISIFKSKTFKKMKTFNDEINFQSFWIINIIFI